MLSESGFTHGDFLRVNSLYVGRSLKVNGSVYRDAYTREAIPLTIAMLIKSARARRWLFS
ncbi:DUF1493 family protein [Pantoea ananatis]|nr:DUF1493 family protein [Pantoea ananatis]